MRGLFLAALAVLALAGCDGKSGGTDLKQQGTGARLSGPEDLKPDASPGENAKLVIRGTEIPVTVAHTRRDDHVVLAMQAHGEELESELYKVGASDFSLVSAAGETYAPAIPLIWFPLNVGDVKTWKGTMATGGEKRNAEATITTASDTLADVAGSPSVIRVVVKLKLDNGTPTMAERDLTFWFAPGRGVLKREFGRGLTREPAED